MGRDGGGGRIAALETVPAADSLTRPMSATRRLSLVPALLWLLACAQAAYYRPPQPRSDYQAHSMSCANSLEVCRRHMPTTSRTGSLTAAPPPSFLEVSAKRSITRSDAIKQTRKEVCRVAAR